MTDQDILERYLKPSFSEGNITYKSPYIAGLEEARILTGRDMTTGKLTNTDKTGSWSGAIIYLILIDHMGKYFESVDFVSENRTSFIRALENFSSLDEKGRFALYALRCSFAHEFSLINIPPENTNKKELKTHRFIVTKRTGELINIPKVSWDGDLKNVKSKTVVDLEEVGNLVESMHSKILSFLENKRLKIATGKSQESLIILSM